MGRTEEMRELYSRWRRSGQSLRAFSRREGIAYAKLMYWHRKLRDSVEITPKPATRRSQESGEFVAVRVVTAPGRPDASPEWFEIRMASGHALRVPPGCDEIELRRLVAVLAAC